MKLITGLTAHDGFELGTSRRFTAEGFLEAPATIARAGVQLYRARELGLDAHGIAPDTVVRLHRPVEELSRTETVESFNGVPVINGNHETVTSDNWRDLAVGDAHGPQIGGKLLNVSRMVVRDKPAIDDVMSGKKYLSIGYKFDVDLTPGTTADGESYDGCQRNIIGNHVLITSNPRGGPACRIADSADAFNKGVRTMKKVIINGIPVEVGDSEAGIIETLINERDAARNQQPSIKIGDATITGSDALINEITSRDKTIAELTAKVPTAEQLTEMVNARVRVLGDAVKLDPEYKPEGKSNKEVMVDVLTKLTAGDSNAKVTVEAVLNGKTIGDAGDELLGAAFRTLANVKPVVAVTAGDAALAAALTGKGSTTTAGDSTATLSGRDAFVQRQLSAWKN